MPWIVEVVEGPAQGRRITLKPGHTVTIGRTEKATEIFPEDAWMSSLHFALGVSGGVLKMQNLSRTNGTEIQGERVEAIALQSGDRVKAGQTVFAVGAPRPSPYPAKARFGGWGLEAIPDGWLLMDGTGYLLRSDAGFHPSITALEEPLPEGKDLAAYVQAQMDLVRSNAPEAAMEGPVAVRMRGAEDALALTITSPVPSGGRAIQRQIYAVCDGIVGIFTATVLDSQAQALRDTFSTIVRGLSYFQG